LVSFRHAVPTLDYLPSASRWNQPRIGGNCAVGEVERLYGPETGQENVPGRPIPLKQLFKVASFDNRLRDDSYWRLYAALNSIFCMRHRD